MQLHRVICWCAHLPNFIRKIKYIARLMSHVLLGRPVEYIGNLSKPKPTECCLNSKIRWQRDMRRRNKSAPATLKIIFILS